MRHIVLLLGLSSCTAIFGDRVNPAQTSDAGADADSQSCACDMQLDACHECATPQADLLPSIDMLSVAGCATGASFCASGTVDGYSFNVVDGASWFDSANDIIMVDLFDVPGACSVYAGGRNSEKASATQLGMTIRAQGTTGTFPIQTGVNALVVSDFSVLDASCRLLDPYPNDQSTAGSITISSITGSAIVGTFDLTFPSGHLLGSFAAPTCAGMAVSNNFSICVP